MYTFSLAEFSTLQLVLLFFFFPSYIYIYINRLINKYVYVHTRGIHIETDWSNESFRRLSCCTHCALMSSCALPSQLASTVQGKLKTGEETEAASAVWGGSYIWVKLKAWFIILISFWDEWERKRIEWRMWKIINKKDQGVLAWSQSSKKNMRSVANGYREMVRSESSGSFRRILEVSFVMTSAQSADCCL